MPTSQLASWHTLTFHHLNNDINEDGEDYGEDSHQERCPACPQNQVGVPSPFSTNGLKHRNQQWQSGRTAMKTMKTTCRVAHGDRVINIVNVVELLQLQLLPPPFSRNLTAAPILSLFSSRISLYMSMYMSKYVEGTIGDPNQCSMHPDEVEASIT